MTVMYPTIFSPVTELALRIIKDRKFTPDSRTFKLVWLSAGFFLYTIYGEPDAIPDNTGGAMLSAQVESLPLTDDDKLWVAETLLLSLPTAHDDNLSYSDDVIAAMNDVYRPDNTGNKLSLAAPTTVGVGPILNLLISQIIAAIIKNATDSEWLKHFIESLIENLTKPRT